MSNTSFDLHSNDYSVTITLKTINAFWSIISDNGFRFSHLPFFFAIYANVVGILCFCCCFGWSEKLFQKRNKEVKNKLNNKLININKAKPKDNSNNEQVKNVYFYRFCCCFVARIAACRNLFGAKKKYMCIGILSMYAVVRYSYSWKHVNGIRCMQSTLEVRIRIRARVSASYELQSSVNTNAPTKGDACATRNPRYNRALSALLYAISHIYNSYIV